MQSASEMGDHINPREGTVQIVEDEEVSVPEAIEEGPAHGDVDGRNEADNHEENKEVQDKNTKILHSQESLHERSFHPGEVVLYAAPQQRQKWGETQVRPRINWGDTFYDLFFVAAAYNVGNILVNSPSAHGLLYFTGCFFPCYNMWRDKTFYDGRFAVADDVFHRLFEAVIFVLAASAILHIRPVEMMSNPRDNPEMFGFALIVAAFQGIGIFGYGEVYFLAEGQRDVIKRSATRDIVSRVVPLLFFSAASVVAGVAYFQNGAGSYNNVPIVSYNSTGDDGHRVLAGDTYPSSYILEETYVNDLPIWLCIAGFLYQMLHMLILIQFLFPSDGRHKQFTVPLNIGFTIHRDSEWIMLMLGESILSLLIVDVTESEDYYVTFYCGILTVVLLQYLHYRSQPHDPDSHAMRRHKNAGIWWGFTNTLYSAALICVGVSYKLFLYDFTFDYRRLEEVASDTETRFLAGQSALSSMPTEERQQAAANVFSASMAIVFFCLDAMLLLHHGLAKSWHRCECATTHKKNKKGIVLTVARVLLIVFFATLSQYENDPNHLAVLGLAGVVAQLIIRRLGFIFFLELEQHNIDSTNEKLADPEEYKWPNVTHAAIAEESSSEDEELPVAEDRQEE